jgi:hypothetical protein
MNQPGLSLDQAPPILVPLRFFFTAPLFASLVSVLALWQGPELLASRWNPPLLAATHLLTLGFLGMVMIGALLQMLPVVAGAPVKRPRLVAWVVHVLACAGVLLLGCGFAFDHSLPLKPAMLLLGTGLLLFSTVIVLSLRRALAGNPTASAMRLAAVALAATVMLGLVLASNHAWGWWLPGARDSVTNLHLTWGLLGWVGLLVTGVAYQTVPMFQLTPDYPPMLTRWLPKSLFVVLAALPLALLFPVLQPVFGLLLAAGYSTFAAMTLRLQMKRRRKLADIPLAFWRVAMSSILLSAALWLAGQIFPEFGSGNTYGLLLGFTMIVGFAMTLVNGMLYRIVPFLIWFHLQSQRKAGARNVPNVKAILPERRCRGQMWLHFATLALLAAAVMRPQPFVYPAAAAFGVSNLWLLLNLYSAYRVYRRLSVA